MHNRTRWHNRLVARAALLALPAAMAAGIGGAPPAAAVAGGVVSVAPGSQNALVGTTATVVANETLGGVAVPGDVVTFLVLSGPNAGRSGSSVTPNAAFSYVSNAFLGTDTIQACAPAATCALATVTWSANSFSNLGSYGVPPITYAPDNSRTEINNYGDRNASYVDNGSDGYGDGYGYDPYYDPYGYDGHGGYWDDGYGFDDGWDSGHGGNRWNDDGWNDDGWHDDWDW